MGISIFNKYKKNNTLKKRFIFQTIYEIININEWIIGNAQ